MKQFRLAAQVMRWMLTGFALTAMAAGQTWAVQCKKDNLCADVVVLDDVVSIDPNPMYEHEYVKFVLWTLPEGFVFVPKMDGVLFKTAQSQFDYGEVVDEDGHASKDKKKRFRWQVKKWQGANLEFPYSIQFHEMNGGDLGRQFFCDPTIINTDSKFENRLKPRGSNAAAVALKCSITP